MRHAFSTVPELMRYETVKSTSLERKLSLVLVWLSYLYETSRMVMYSQLD